MIVSAVYDQSQQPCLLSVLPVRLNILRRLLCILPVDYHSLFRYAVCLSTNSNLSATDSLDRRLCADFRHRFEEQHAPISTSASISTSSKLCEGAPSTAQHSRPGQKMPRSTTGMEDYRSCTKWQRLTSRRYTTFFTAILSVRGLPIS